jgi:hypothetical protein
MMWTAIVVSALLFAGNAVLAVGLVLLGVIGTACIVFAVPTRELVLAERAAFERAADG